MLRKDPLWVNLVLCIYPLYGPWKSLNLNLPNGQEPCQWPISCAEDLKSLRGWVAGQVTAAAAAAAAAATDDDDDDDDDDDGDDGGEL